MTARPLATLVALAWSSAAVANDRVVCGDEPVLGCYTSIAAAVEAAFDGDTIALRTGYHIGAVVLDQRELTFRPADGADSPAIAGDGSTNATLKIIGGKIVISTLILGNADGRVIEMSDGAIVEINDSQLTATGLQTRGGIVEALDSTFSCLTCYFEGGTSMRSGGQIYARDTDLVIQASRMVGGTAALSGGSIVTIQETKGSLLVEDSYFIDNLAVSSAGAAINAGGSGALRNGGSITIRGTRFERNTSRFEGAIHLHYGASPVLIEESIFSGNAATTGSSTLTIHDVGPTEIRRATFCGNGADASDGDAGVISGAALVSLSITNNVFVDNTQTSIWLTRAIPTATIYNNHFVGNTATSTPILNAGFTVGVGFTDNLIVGNTGLSQQIRKLVSVEETTGLELHHNLWWQNDPQVQDFGDQEVYADPRIDSYKPGGRCDYIDETRQNERDPLWPSWYGAARDAGSERAMDLDASTADIGAFGGPDARDAPDWDDADGDGVPTLFDCNRFDATIGSGLSDIAYNGIDEDCRGDDDYDADDDGLRPAEWTVAGQPVDCDDEDARRFPGQPEIASNGIDDDCDGWADNTGSLRSAACDAAPASRLAWGLIVAGLALRRRRQR